MFQMPGQMLTDILSEHSWSFRSCVEDSVPSAPREHFERGVGQERRGGGGLSKFRHGRVSAVPQSEYEYSSAPCRLSPMKIAVIFCRDHTKTTFVNDEIIRDLLATT